MQYYTRPGILSNLDIDNYYRNTPAYGGCISKDELPPLQQGKFYIVNMANHDARRVGHWCLLSLLNGDAIWCDAFGAPAPESVVSAMRRTHDHIWVSNVDEQALTQEWCGYYCLYVANALLAGRSLTDVLLHDLHPLHYRANTRVLSKLKIQRVV